MRRLLPVKVWKQIAEQLSQFIFINATTMVLQRQNTLINTTTLNASIIYNRITLHNHSIIKRLVMPEECHTGHNISESIFLTTDTKHPSRLFYFSTRCWSKGWKIHIISYIINQFCIEFTGDDAL